MNSNNTSKEALIKKIKQVVGQLVDPDIYIPFNVLKMVGKVSLSNYSKNDASEFNANITIKLTTLFCPQKEKIEESVCIAIKKLKQIKNVTVEFVEMEASQKQGLREVVAKYRAEHLKESNFGKNSTNKSTTNKNGSSKSTSNKNNEKNPNQGVAKKNENESHEQNQELDLPFKRVIAVSSGKGGVGKSSISVNLATLLQLSGKKVGILDADIYGYSVLSLIGINPNSLGKLASANSKTGKEELVPAVSSQGVKVISLGMFVDENQPAILRGPLTHKLLAQFLEDTAWGNLDILIIDLPPGTGDIAISLSQLIKNIEFLVITTPDEQAGIVAKRIGILASKNNKKVIGVVENMSWFIDESGEKHEIFGTKGGTQTAISLSKLTGVKIPLISLIPLDLAFSKASAIDEKIKPAVMNPELNITTRTALMQIVSWLENVV